MLCVLIYVRTGCGLRTVVSILKIFEEVLGESFGKTPSYNSVANWVRKLGLSVYEDDKTLKQKYAVVIDESIMVNKEKLLLVLGFNAGHEGRPLGHRDVTVLDMRVGAGFRRNDVKASLESVSRAVGAPPEYGVSDGAHNLKGGFKDVGITHHLDISHTLGNCMKHVYGEDPDFLSLTEKLGKIRLQYHLTDKAWLLPPNMRTIARFMNLREWTDWAMRLLECYDTLEDDMKEAYAFILPYKNLIHELWVCTKSIEYVEELCKNQGFGFHTNILCKNHIIRNVIGNASARRASAGLKMLDYFKSQASLMPDGHAIRHISSDIIEADFGIFKAKKSPNKLYGITSLVLMLPLYPKTIDYSIAKKQDFKVRLANVKLKDLDLWAKENLSDNKVQLRSNTLKRVG